MTRSAAGDRRPAAGRAGATGARGPTRAPATWPARLLLGAGALALSGVGCSEGRIPLPQIPQLQEAGELGAYGGDRTRTGQACQASSDTQDAYIQCMASAGYVFIARENVYPANECWSIRDAGDPRRQPPSYCFHRAPEAGRR